MPKKYKLLKSILDYPKDYIASVYNDELWLGADGEWKIPLSIVLKYPNWFMPILGY